MFLLLGILLFVCSFLLDEGFFRTCVGLLSVLLFAAAMFIKPVLADLKKHDNGWRNRRNQ
jgi:hypothetical protein